MDGWLDLGRRYGPRRFAVYSIHSWLAEGLGNPIAARLALVPPTNEIFTVGSY